jgi:peptidyl-prolyl cis-trans isomerase A (cyclophilin A)
MRLFVLSACLGASLAWTQAAPGPAPSGEPVLVELNTVLGRIVIAVDVARAPVTAANFLRYVDAGHYDGARFHRVWRPGGDAGPAFALESIQAGLDPLRDPDRLAPIPQERTADTGLLHKAGVVSMARGPRADSARAEDFILLADEPGLDHGGTLYADRQGAAAFGRVVEGLEIARRIQWQPAAAQALTPPVLIIRAARRR